MCASTSGIYSFASVYMSILRPTPPSFDIVIYNRSSNKVVYKLCNLVLLFKTYLDLEISL